MAKREWKLKQAAYFTQLLNAETSDRKIAKVMGCRRTLVKSLRGLTQTEIEEKLRKRNLTLNYSPDWGLSVNWSEVTSLIQKGFEIKRIWEESAQCFTTYSNFWKYMENCVSRSHAIARSGATLKRWRFSTPDRRAGQAFLLLLSGSSRPYIQS